MPTFVLMLIVANTDLRLLRWLSATFTGESIFSQSLSQRNWSKKTCYSWRLFEGRAAQILERIKPYLICKREQAEVGLAYRTLREQGSKGRKLTFGDIKDRDVFRNRIRVLNGSETSDATREMSNG